MKIAILSKDQKLYSTSRLKEAAEKAGHEVIILDHTSCSVVMEKGQPGIMYEGNLIEGVNAIIPRIGSSVTFYGTSVVRQFEMMNTFTTAGSQAVLRSRDKLRSLQLLAREGLGIPKTVFANHPQNDEVERLINYVGGTPIIIKLLEGTQGVGVVLAETDASAKSVIEAFSGIKTNILIQEYIKESKGTDIRAFVVNGEIVGAMERKGKEGEFRSNLHRGGSGSIVELTAREKSAAIKAAKSLGLPIAGVDMLRSARGPLIVEVNSSPGLEGIENTTKVDIAGKIIEYIEQNAARKRTHVRIKS